LGSWDGGMEILSKVTSPSGFDPERNWLHSIQNKILAHHTEKLKIICFSFLNIY